METKIFLQMALDRANHVDPVQQIALSEQDGLSPAKPIISQKIQLMGIASLYPSYAPIWVSGETEIFCKGGWTGKSPNSPVGQSD
jgi:hypothetical protein